MRLIATLLVLAACVAVDPEPKDSPEVDPCDLDGDGSCADDCDEFDPAVYPGAAELCDGEDNNCDGSVDEGLDVPWYIDVDADGYGLDKSQTARCAPPGANWIATAGDCDDGDANVNPAAVEVCDGIDNDCDGTVDAGLTATFYDDSDADGFGDPSTEADACEPPGPTWGTIAGDCNDAEPLAWAGASEVCDEVDNNCDGKVDEGVLTTFFHDADGDGFGDPDTTGEACAEGAGLVADSSDCDDALFPINPAAVEVCDLVDNNCDGAIDEGVKSTFYADTDGDTRGDPASLTEACASPGDSWTTDATDCNDAESLAWTDAAEACDEIDNNCDGIIDEGVTTAFYADADGDAHGDPATKTEACTVPGDSWTTDSTDCDDGEALAWTAATEVCDYVDNNCDGAVDEGVEPTWRTDSDGDGYGASEAPSCVGESGMVEDGQDCDDADAGINPAVSETCNGIDEDCDGVIDDGAIATWFYDADGDGHGASDVSTEACPSPGAGWLASGDDCDDTGPLAWTGATETGDGADNDCDGAVDELRDPDLTFSAGVVVGPVASEEDGGWIAAWDGGYAGIAHPLDFLDGDARTKTVDTGDLPGPLDWFADVDGDGHRDLFTTCTLEYPYYTSWGVVYAWADVTVFDVDCTDAVAEFGADAGDATGLGTWASEDGEDVFGYLVGDGGPGIYFVVPVSALASGSVGAADAIASIDASLFPHDLGPGDAEDVDGDGINDLLLVDTDDGSLRLFSAADLDSHHIDPTSSFWSLDYDSEDPRGRGLTAFFYPDLDGDGYADVVGHSYAGSSSSPTCTAFGVLGPLSGEIGWAEVTDTISYPEPTDCGDLEVIDDLDGDGLPDVVVGVQPGGSDSADPGRLDLFLGRDLAGGGALDPELDRWMVREVNPGDALGFWLLSADFDGDGAGDLTANWAPTEDESGTTYEGGAGVWFDIANPG